jgi:hypothetical protein
MRRILGFLLLAPLLLACSESGEPARRVHTEFTPESGLTVSDSSGRAQRLIEHSLAARALVSPDGRWIVAEDMKYSNLTTVRFFQDTGESYREIRLPAVRRHWEQLARNAGIAYEDLMNTRLGIEGFGADGNSVILSFRAEAEQPGGEEILSRLEVALSPPMPPPSR